MPILAVPNNHEVRCIRKLQLLKKLKQDYLETVDAQSIKHRVVRSDIEALSFSLRKLEEQYDFRPVIKAENEYRRLKELGRV